MGEVINFVQYREDALNRELEKMFRELSEEIQNIELSTEQSFLYTQIDTFEPEVQKPD